MEYLIAALIFITVILFFYSINFIFFDKKTSLQGNIIQRRLRSIVFSSRPSGVPNIALKIRLSELPWLDSLLKKFPSMVYLATYIDQNSFICTLGGLFLFGAVIWTSVFFVCNLTKSNFLTSIGVATIFASIPFVWVMYNRYKRIRQFSDQFPDCVSMISSSIRAGQSFSGAMEIVSKEMPNPVAVEFKKALIEMQLGLNLNEALTHLQRRVSVPDLNLFISAVLLQRETGGNLSEFLDRLELTIRERFKMRRELKSLTAPSKISGWILGALPIGLMFSLFILNSNYIKILFQEPIGVKMCFLAGGLQIIGLVLIRMITNIKI